MGSNFVQVVSNAVAVVGGNTSDYRVQAGVVALLIVVGSIGLVVHHIHKRKAK
jgi:hypothetical protein